MAKLTIPEVLPRVRAYMQRPSNGDGGALHIWLADFNVSDDDMRFCEAWAGRMGDAEGVELARIGMALSKTQRRKLARLAYG